MTDTKGLTSLTLESLAVMDGGRIGTAMEHALKRIAADMDDRPGDDRARKVTLEIAAVPVVEESGLIDGAKLQIQVKESLPTRKSKVYDVGVRKGGMLVFQPMALDNHKQTTAFDDEE